MLKSSKRLYKILTVFCFRLRHFEKVCKTLKVTFLEQRVIEMKTRIKIKMLWLALLMSIALTACTTEGEDNLGSIEEQENVGGIEPTFLELEYMYSFEVDYFFHASRVEGEFTLFQTYGSGGAFWGSVSFNTINAAVKNTQHFELPEHVDLGRNSFITISMGRELQMLYYYEEHQRYLPTNEVIARPVFEREYHPNTVFVYRVTPLPKYSFIYQEMFTDDFRQFNTLNNIPFEVWPFDTSSKSGMAASPGYRIRGSTLGEGWQELTEPLEGYVRVEETYLRSLPTEHSIAKNHLTYGIELVINGSVEGGMEIDGNGRWYFVRTSWAGGNRNGYIHSSFVTITSEIDDD